MKQKKILIVDDDPYVLLALAVRLRANGYCVVSATDAGSAIQQEREEKPDLVILDVGLPGEDGISVLQRMKIVDDVWAAPTIVLSAKDPFGNRERALKAGAIAFIQKPPNNNALLSAIRHALGGAQGTGGETSTRSQPA